ncbi:hypothetical protein KDW_43050 [Dictyobacter vulcani]|uniref:Uncharacterized protein n=1 Tax=Dictyobacter vulcani TaxID=2607529 RepID=A0A5J4KR93_9CHLR|nr:hypothetical protein [Dictyobacter vulcani]GER90143.1 hypothetical protein KDW_43050 [Dictyobacter vulcani]
MWRFALYRSWRQPLKSLFAISGFLLASCALVLLSATTQTAAVQANQSIDQNWRPAYDLVVLPPGTKLPTNQPIPPDYMERFAGGISFAQYETIKRISGIDVAAPVAYVGYMSLPQPNIYFGQQDPRPGYYQLDWTTTASNGQHTIVEAQQHQVIFLGPELCEAEQKVVDQLRQSGVIGMACLHAGDVVYFYPPQTGHYLLAAIDPDAEDRLMHLGKSITQGRMFTAQDTLQDDQRLKQWKNYSRDGTYLPTQAIPLLVHEQLPGQIQIQAHFTYLASDDLSFQQVLKHGGAHYLQQQPHQKTEYVGLVPAIYNNPQNLAGASMRWDGQHWQTALADPKNPYQMGQLMVNFSQPLAPGNLSYQPTTGPNGQAAYSLVPTGTLGPEATFRKLQPLKTTHTQMTDILYSYNVVGAFSDSAVTPQFSNPLNWLPENTYTVAPTTVRYDAHGRPVAPTKLIPTTNSLGSLIQPPLALTTLDAARQLRPGNTISAIRIRVAGVENASDASWQRVQQVATQIQQRTH